MVMKALGIMRRRVTQLTMIAVLRMLRNVRIRAARVADLQAILHVLDTCALHCSDVDPSSHLYHIAALGKEVIGCACGERHGNTVVIQAVGVLPAYRDQQLATHLVGAVLMRARANGCTTAALFTTAHPSFFARFGFSLTYLDSLPKEVKLSKRFLRRFGARTYCMCRRLD